MGESKAQQSIPDTVQTDLASLSDERLLVLRASLSRELKKRKIAMTVGEVGERLALEHFRTTPGLPKLQLAPRGTKNVDALSRSGDRYSIKSICDAKKTGTIYPDSDDPNRQLFEYLLIVRLTEDWLLRSIHQLAWADFLKVRAWDKRMNAWYVGLTERALASAKAILAVDKRSGAPQ